ncbi:MAG: hypothetical protein ACD_44C00451G0001, partial [uncultured bacterium]
MNLPIDEAVKNKVFDELRADNQRRVAHPELHAMRPLYLNLTTQQLGALLALPPTQFSSAEREDVLGWTMPYLGGNIETMAQLTELLKTSAFSEEQLNHAQRVQILRAVKVAKKITVTRIAREFPMREYLAVFCENTAQMVWWLSLPMEQFNAEQRTELLTAILPNLHALIPTEAVLDQLLGVNGLSLEQLTNAQALTILYALLQNPQSFLYAGGNPIQAFIQLTSVALALKTSVLRLLQTSGLLANMLIEYQQFYDLFQLEWSQFYDEQRQIVFDAVASKIATLITTVPQLVQLFILPKHHLSPTMREKIGMSLLQTFDALIGNNANHLIALITLIQTTDHCPVKFREACQKKIINEIDRFTHTIQDGEQLSVLLSLPLLLKQQEKIFQYFSIERLKTLIQTWEQFFKIITSDYTFKRMSSLTPKQQMQMCGIVTPAQLMLWITNAGEKAILAKIMEFTEDLGKPLAQSERTILRAATKAIIATEGGKLIKQEAR